MRASTWAGLIAANVIWSVHPAMSKLILADFGPAHGAWFRYTGALAAYLLAMGLARVLPRTRRKPPEVFIPASRPRDLGLACALGFAAFSFSPMLMMTGLSMSRATDNAIIVAMEPLMAVFLAAFFLREKLSPEHWGALALSLTGFALLSGMGKGSLAGARDVGNLLILASMAGEAAYSVIGRGLVARHPPLPIFGTGLAAGVVVLTGVVVGSSGLPDLSHLTWKSAAGILWVGPLGTTACYLYWIHVLREATVASLAVTLFVQPVLGAVWGNLFLDEKLTATQGMGAALILTGVCLPAAIGLRPRARGRAVLGRKN